MDQMSGLANTITTTSVALSAGNGITGILVRKTIPEDVEEVSFAYSPPSDSINIIEDKDYLAGFSRSVTVSKEAFEKAVKMNVSIPFVALVRFNNLSTDGTVLGNEVLAVEMEAPIINLTDKLSIIFRNLSYKGIQLVNHGMVKTPLNETISSSDLKTLTMISQIGCGLSMFFLSIALFMHFFIRKTKANKATRILIQLMVAMLLLNFTFLINTFVASSKSSVGCKIIAALMHYFLLATFTWFAVQALHLCLQVWGKVSIRRYILKVSITSWVLPCVVGIVLVSIGTYGEQIIHTDNIDDNVAMCWMTDTNVHYIVNIGYYALIFLFTFTTFVIIVTWLIFLRRFKADNEQSRNNTSIVTIMGLCCILGITWGFAFFAYGVLQIPSYYIFTALNSLQGFFLFIYYYKTRQPREMNHGINATSTTLKTSLEISENPLHHSHKITPWMGIKTISFNHKQVQGIQF